MNMDPNAFAFPLHLLPVFVLVAFCLSLLTLLVLTLIDSGIAQTYARQRLDERLSISRMARMLSARGIDRAHYLNSVPMAEVRRQLARCRDCDRTAQCDRAFLGGCTGGSRFEFCPNVAVLDALQPALAHGHGAPAAPTPAAAAGKRLSP